METKETKQNEYWNETAEKLLKGRTIKSVRYMTDKEMTEMMWNRKGVIMTLDNDTEVIVSSDDEGNDAGSLFVGNDILPVI